MRRRRCNGRWRAQSVHISQPSRTTQSKARVAPIVCATTFARLHRLKDTRGDQHCDGVSETARRYPSEKYTGAAYHNIAAALNSGVSFEAAIEFVRRLALTALTGNGDMHLKNWSLLYPGDGRTPTLSPVYDVLSTIPYIPKDGMALSLAGEKSFKALTQERWRSFANRSRLPEGAVMTAVAETAADVRAKWSVLPARDVVPAQVLERIDAHVDEMAAILAP